MVRPLFEKHLLFAKEIGNMNSGTKFTDYSRQYFETEFSQFGAPLFGDKLQYMLKIFENSYVPFGTDDNDHLAWLKATVDVRLKRLSKTGR